MFTLFVQKNAVWFRFDEGDQVLFKKKHAAMFRLLES